MTKFDGRRHLIRAARKFEDEAYRLVEESQNKPADEESILLNRAGALWGQAGVYYASANVYQINPEHLSLRATNCLKRAGIVTWQQVMSMTDWELLEIRNLGLKSLQEIRRVQYKIFEEEPHARSV